MIKPMLLTLGLMVSIAQWASGAIGTTTVCKWKDNMQAAWTMSVDDNGEGDISFVTSVLNPKGIKMTWYISTNVWSPNWDLWRSIAAQGHELGSHAVTHPDLTSLSLAAARAELRDSKTKIEQEVPANGRCLSIAYPGGCNDTTIRITAAEYYIVARGVTGGNNAASPSINPLDGRNLCAGTDGSAGSMFDLLANSSHATSVVDEVLTSGGWVCDEYHGINDGGGYNVPTATFITLANYLYGKRDVVWTGSAKEVSQYIYERNASAIQVVSVGQAQIVLNLTHALDTTVCPFTFPLTLKTEVDATWDSVTVTQTGASAGKHAITESTIKYVYFDARPNKGQITLAKSTTAVRQPPMVRQAEAGLIPGSNPIKAEILRRYLTQQKSALVYDLAGKMIAPETLSQPGIYLVTGSEHGLVKKVVVVR